MFVLGSEVFVLVGSKKVQKNFPTRKVVRFKSVQAVNDFFLVTRWQRWGKNECTIETFLFRDLDDLHADFQDIDKATYQSRCWNLVKSNE